jgi:hypothetical protein
VSEDEVFVLVISVVFGVIGVARNTTSAFPPLSFRGNPALGIVRVSVILAMLWIAYVLWNYADPSVTGVYVFFYLVMGYGAVKMYGQTMAAAFGASTQHDAGERRNVAAAILIAALTISTGMIFGGSLWGEADPLSDAEGGWWIPVAFFHLGWGCLMGAFALYIRRDKGKLWHQIRRERDVPAARAAGAFLISCAIPLTEAVSGDFWGWRHGLASVGIIGALLIAHELFASWSGGGADAAEVDVTKFDTRRIAETVAYLVIGGAAWGLHRMADRWWGPG